MMALNFELVTPVRIERCATVHRVTVPGVEGEFSVLEGHAPFMTPLRDGLLSIYAEAGAGAAGAGAAGAGAGGADSSAEAPEVIAIKGGFAEVSEKGLTILAERIVSKA